jgi:hypothetical protein
MRFTITESERSNILKMYGLLVEDKRPLEKLMECKFTSDGKYVVYEGKAYYVDTGEETLLNESWSLSDILHAGADVLSAGLDFVIPGSGAVVDVLNAISYIIEAQFKGDEEKDSLYLMAAITFAFVILPGPLQAISIPLKRAVKTGVGLTSKVVVKGLGIIGKSLKFILGAIPNLIGKALKSPLAKRILGKFGTKISGYVSKFSTRVTALLSKITPKATIMTGMRAGGKKALTSFLSKMPKIKKGSFFLRRMGFVKGKPYRYIGPSGKAMTGTIEEITDTGVKVLFKGGNRTWTTSVPVETFVKGAIGAPWMRRGYSVVVPLFIKRLSDVVLDDGSIDYNALDKMEDLNPDETSKESLDFMAEEVAGYEGESGQYTENSNVAKFQNALIKLGYTLPKFGADGKFGPETQSQLTKFQEENELTSSVGKMDRYTAKKMAEILKSKNIPDSETLQSELGEI